MRYSTLLWVKYDQRYGYKHEKIWQKKMQKIAKFEIFWKINFSVFSYYLWSHLTYRSVLYLNWKLETFHLDLMLSTFWLKSISYERGSSEVVSFFLTQTLQDFKKFARFCKILQDSVRFCKLLEASASLCKLLQDLVRFCKILQDFEYSESICNISQDFARFCKIQQYSVSKIIYDFYKVHNNHLN